MGKPTQWNKLPQSPSDTTGLTSLEIPSRTLKHARRQQAAQLIPQLEICVHCGDKAVHRHSASGHARPVNQDVIVPLCRACHGVIHSDDKLRGASWAWRNPR